MMNGKVFALLGLVAIAAVQSVSAVTEVCEDTTIVSGGSVYTSETCEFGCCYDNTGVEDSLCCAEETTITATISGGVGGSVGFIVTCVLFYYFCCRPNKQVGTSHTTTVVTVS